MVREVGIAPFFGVLRIILHATREARLRLLESSGNVFGGEDDSLETRRTISWRSKENKGIYSLHAEMIRFYNSEVLKMSKQTLPLMIRLVVHIAKPYGILNSFHCFKDPGAIVQNR